MTDPQQDSPLISVVRGQPTDAEVAAVLAVLAGGARVSRLAAEAVRSETAKEARAKLSSWSMKTALMRQPIASGPDAWRRSFLPT